MFGRWRRSDGFKWVAHVPTQIVMRRRARKERLRAAAINIGDSAQDAARRSIAGLEYGVVKAGAAVAKGGNVVAAGIGDGLFRGARLLWSGGQAAASGLWLRLLGTAQTPMPARAQRGLLVLTALIGLGIAGRLALHGMVQGQTTHLDFTSRMLLAAGFLALLLAGLPWAWRMCGPYLARTALQAIKTRRATDAAPTAARAGSLAIAAALTATAVGGGGWAVWRVTSAILGSGGSLDGIARVIGVQALKIGDAEVRLAGIAAPEISQSCGEGSRKSRCGEEARRGLVKAVGGKQIKCQLRGVDASGYRLAQCFDGANDVAAVLVGSGLVWADRDDTLGYRALEAAPRTAKSGVWKSASSPPWTYRERIWDEAQRDAPDGCPIKAQATSSGRYYHLPWDDRYHRVTMSKRDIARGTRQWFCTEAEALSAGFKPVLQVK